MERILTRRDIRVQNKQKILDFIRDYRAKYQVSPRLREIAEAVTGKPQNEGNISVWIEQLIVEGYLTRAVPGASRALVLTDPQPTEPYEER